VSRDVPKDVAASVRARLMNEARSSRRPFNELLQYYAIERFLFRLGKSPYAERFILKGALMLRAVNADPTRPTRDIDLLDRDPSMTGRLEHAIRDCISVEVEDGMRFDPTGMTSEEITREAANPGVRITFAGYLGTARIPVQIDVGVGDAVVPGPIWIEYPEILDYGQPRLLAYTLESVVAEKYQAMVWLGAANSRMKDFYDISFMARKNAFDGEVLGDAMRQTFARRDTEIPSKLPVALTSAFYDDPVKTRQWGAFLRRTKLAGPQTLRQVVEEVSAFVVVPSIAIAVGGAFPRRWAPGGPWKSPDATGEGPPMPPV
jgi:nucleotidyltransferase AbiEii toxin of type IV toxin-antitoxin system